MISFSHLYRQTLPLRVLTIAVHCHGQSVTMEMIAASQQLVAILCQSTPQTECNNITMDISFTGKKVKVSVCIIHTNYYFPFKLRP